MFLKWEWQKHWNKLHSRILKRNNNLFIWSKLSILSAFHQCVYLISNLFSTFHHKCNSALPQFHPQWHQFRFLHFQKGLSECSSKDFNYAHIWVRNNFKNCEESFWLKDLQVWSNTLEEITISTFLPEILTMPTLGKGQFQEL